MQNDNIQEEDDKNFYESSESEKEAEPVPKKKSYVMDGDHRLLLRTCKPLLNSRNAAVSKHCVNMIGHLMNSMKLVILLHFIS